MLMGLQKSRHSSKWMLILFRVFQYCFQIEHIWFTQKPKKNDETSKSCKIALTIMPRWEKQFLLCFYFLGCWLHRYCKNKANIDNPVYPLPLIQYFLYGSHVCLYRSNVQKCAKFLFKKVVKRTNATLEQKVNPFGKSDRFVQLFWMICGIVVVAHMIGIIFVIHNNR